MQYNVEVAVKLIGTLCKEYNISLEELRQHFPNRPTDEVECNEIAAWIGTKIKATTVAEDKPQTPSPAPAPQGAPIANRRDKNGKPMPSYYAVEMGGVVKFFRIKAGRKAGWFFIDVQASDEFHAIRNYTTKMEILKAIQDFGPTAAMEAYGQHIGSCGHCHRTLTDASSRAIGIGPVCRADM